MFGNPETTTGGNALKFYASVRMDIRRIGAIKEGDNVTGNRTRIKVVKNKVAPPFKQVEFDIMYGTGISKEGDLVDLAVAESIVEKAGAWYSYNNAKIGQGRENAKRFLMENTEIMEEIREKVLIKHGLLEGDTSNIDMTTGEIMDEEDSSAPAKKTKKAKKLQ